MSETLKPCPFCGSSPIVGGKQVRYISCENESCVIAAARGYANAEDAIAAWNIRPAEDAYKSEAASHLAALGKLDALRPPLSAEVREALILLIEESLPDCIRMHDPDETPCESCASYEAARATLRSFLAVSQEGK